MYAWTVVDAVFVACALDEARQPLWAAWGGLVSCPIVQAYRLDGLQAGEGLLEGVAGDLVFLHEQRVEDGLVEEAALDVVAA
ncbi:hypothetical protein [Actinomadura soli]|uniref:hypothetical protein n=1 Tax=Actinomadura soli TaxID=2508997 RepID=UPI001E57FDAE|nr:hypothetical protein [Actinomadura soli]